MKEKISDYPRPPIIESSKSSIIVKLDKEILAQTSNSKRVLETTHPPSYYLPRNDINMALLNKNSKKTVCEYKGVASYFDLIDQENNSVLITDVGWSYENPSKGYLDIKNFISFYPEKVNCFVDGEKVNPEGGGFYGGWITSDIDLS